MVVHLAAQLDLTLVEKLAVQKVVRWVATKVGLKEQRVAAPKVLLKVV